MGFPDQRHDLGPRPWEPGIPDVDLGHQLRTESQQTGDLRAVRTVVRSTGTVRKPVGQQEENVAICHAEVTQLQSLQSSAGPSQTEASDLTMDPGPKGHGCPAQWVEALARFRECPERGLGRRRGDAEENGRGKLERHEEGTG